MMLNDVKPYCDIYGFKVNNIFGQVHISTKYEKWYFESNINPQAKIRLMHKNRRDDRWHCQFRENVTPEELVLYLKEHEDSKYRCFVDFHIGYNGQKKKNRHAAV